jgi:outer membrane protein
MLIRDERGGSIFFPKPARAPEVQCDIAPLQAACSPIHSPKEPIEMNKVLAVVVMFAIVGVVPLANAAQGDLILRLNAINIDPDASSDIPGLDVDDQATAAIGLTYFLRPQWAVDFGIATAKHDITLGGARIGSTRILPINITGQYHFMPDAPIRPYVGAGLNYTRFSDVDILGGAVGLDRDSFGPVLQVGLDWAVTDRVLVNFDVKRAWISTDVSGAATGSVDIDPWVYGIGVGFRF